MYKTLTDAELSELTRHFTTLGCPVGEFAKIISTATERKIIESLEFPPNDWFKESNRYGTPYFGNPTAIIKAKVDAVLSYIQDLQNGRLS